MGFLSSRNDFGGDMQSSISLNLNDKVGESYQSALPASILEDDSHHILQSHELDPNFILSFENDTSMEEFRDEWICLHLDPSPSSRPYGVDGTQIEDHDESFFVGGRSSSDDAHLNLNFSGISSNGSGPKCNRSWDGILCWPETPEGSAATLSCFSHLNGIQYDTSRTVSRLCEEGGYWQKTTNYSSCVPMASSQVPDEGLGVTIHVYFFGYCLSLTALIIAMIIFLSFKELRCLRNKIHTNLIVTYILADTLWIITNFTTAAQSMSQKGNNVGSRVSCITFILLHYFHLTNFFMMFVEGLYLYVLVVQTFMAENIKLRVYAAIGWGIPLLIMVVWSITKWVVHRRALDTLHIPQKKKNREKCLVPFY